DIVVAEDGDRLAGANGGSDALCRRIHVLQMARIGERVAQARLEEDGRRVEIDAARREDARQDIGKAETLRQRQGQPVIALPQPPAAATDRALDLESPDARPV